jgi:N-dimethylarginine dimethylaminohydrolase
MRWRGSRTEVGMGKTYGSQSMVDPLRRVVVRRPDDAFGDADPKTWGYSGRPNLDAARREHDALVDLVRASGADVWYHDEPTNGLADAIFVHDPVLVTDRGALVLRMGKERRRGEEAAIGGYLKKRGVPILGTLQSPATAEGGDLLWIHHDWLSVGQGFRTNADGLRQIDALVKPAGIRTEGVPLPYYTGPAACLHLMSLISLVDDDLAVIYPRLLPVPFWQRLKAERFDFIEVPDAEFDRMAPNVLAVAPRDCIMLEGNPITQQRLEEAGCRVRTYRGNEISLKAEGGATCLTRPVLRAR